MLILPIFLTVCFHKKNLHNSIFPTLCPWTTNTVVLLAVEQSVLSRRGELGGDPCSTKGRANRECAALIFHTAQNENHFDDVPFPLSPSWHLLITSDVLSLRPTFGVFSVTSSDSFYYKAGTLEGKSNLFQFSFYMEKLAICWSC